MTEPATDAHPNSTAIGGKSMVQGDILVGDAAPVTLTSDGHDGHVVAPAVVGGGTDPLGTAGAAESAEEHERNAEISDLKRRVPLGTVLTAPVLFAVMFTEFFDVTWIPEALLNHWFQLALITPVMLYTGWPIHRTGWLAMSHRTADMNSLITLARLRPSATAWS